MLTHSAPLLDATTVDSLRQMAVMDGQSLSNVPWGSLEMETLRWSLSITFRS